MQTAPRLRLLLCLLAILTLNAAAAHAVTVSISSGVSPTTFYALPSGACQTGFPTVFGPADFAAASSGPPAVVVAPFSVWVSSLQCDPTAQWLSTGPNLPSISALYATPFTVDLSGVCCIKRAVLSFCWAADDAIGDQPGFGPVVNPDGVYLNGTGLPITAGSYASQTQVAGVDVTALLQCGNNTLYVYNRDLGCAVAGLIFNARIDITDCTTSAKATTWGSIRRVYR